MFAKTPPKDIDKDKDKDRDVIITFSPYAEQEVSHRVVNDSELESIERRLRIGLKLMKTYRKVRYEWLEHHFHDLKVSNRLSSQSTHNQLI